jgi:hypothetical protein
VLRIDLKRLALGIALTMSILVLAILLSSALEPPIGTPRPTASDWAARALAGVALVIGAWFGCRNIRVGRLVQGIVSILTNWLVFGMITFIAGRFMRPSVGFDYEAFFWTAAPIFLLLGGVGVALANLESRIAGWRHVIHAQ